MPFSLPSLPSTRWRSERRLSRRPSRRRASARGFSLVEMLVVVAIVGLLIGLVGPAAMRQLQSSRGTTAAAQIQQLRSAVDIFAMDVGRYPNEAEGLRALVANPGGLRGWNGPYLRDGRLPEDPWGVPFNYRLNGSSVVIFSLGADGRVGGEGQDADISS
ncbi:MAG: type II secretion system major pseudopilin GspG [Pseudomonadota bacterium]